MKTIFYILLTVIGIGVTGCADPDYPKDTADAVASAESWLSLVDNGKYQESWQTAATLFKGAVPEKQWIQTMTAARKPFGKTLSRKLDSKSFHTTLPGAPDGEYLVIVFKTSFENKQIAIETITPMREKDGLWRVSGYYIK